MKHAPVYMDYHATTPVDSRVMESMMPFFSEHFGNAASLHHRFGWIAKEAVENARKKIADAIGAQSREIIFTSGATESNNLAIKGAVRNVLPKGNHIITTQVEHKCVLETCKKLESEGYTVTYLPVNRFGEVSVDEIRKNIQSRTILISVMSANNEIGTIQPIEDIGKVCEEHEILFHTDATQAVGRIPIDVKKMNIHLLSFASHKMYGPKGVGALYVRMRNPHVVMESQIDGAGHEFGLRSGTVNVPGIVGFGKAVDIAMTEMESENERLSGLRDRLQKKLLELDAVSVNGSMDHRLSHNLNVTFQGISAEQLINEMGDVAVSAGAACASAENNAVNYSHVLKAIRLDDESIAGTIRFGLGRMTTDEEIEYVARKIITTVQKQRTFALEGTL